MRVLNLVCVLLIAVVVAVNCDDIVSYLRNPSYYRFGSEVAGFRYYSPRHFLGVAILSVAIGIIGLVGPMLLKSKRTAVALRAAAAGILVVMSFVLSSK